MLAALIGYASLVAAGFDIAPATFQRTLERLLDLQNDVHQGGRDSAAECQTPDIELDL